MTNGAEPFAARSSSTFASILACTGPSVPFANTGATPAINAVSASASQSLTARDFRSCFRTIESLPRVASVRERRYWVGTFRTRPGIGRRGGSGAPPPGYSSALLSDDRGAGELAAIDAGDRIFLSEERDAHRRRARRRPIDDRASHVVVACAEDVEVGARVEVVVLAVGGARVVDRGHVHTRVVEGRPRAHGQVPGRRAGGPENQAAEGEDRRDGRVLGGVEAELRRAGTRRTGRSLRTLWPGRPGRPRRSGWTGRPLRSREPARAAHRRDDGRRKLGVLPQRDEPPRLGRPRRLDAVHRTGIPGKGGDRAPGRAAGR